MNPRSHTDPNCLNNMRTQSQLKFATGFFPIMFAPLFDLLCLFFMLLVVAPFFAFQNTIDIKLPRTITSDVILEKVTTITITGENIIYFENKIFSNKELKKRLQGLALKKQSILIKADGRSSLTRIVDVWNICRELGIEKVNIATSINK